MAENFSDYPIYDVFFENDERKTRRIFYFFWFRMYTRRKFSYVTDNKDLVISFQKPGDKLCSPIGLILNPRFLFGFLRNIPFTALKRVLEFGRMEAPLMKKYYDPTTDSFIHAVCVNKSARGGKILIQSLKELYDGRAVYCETHSDKHVKLYKYLGMELCETAVFHGVKHYVLKSRAKTEE